MKKWIFLVPVVLFLIFIGFAFGENLNTTSTVPIKTDIAYSGDLNIQYNKREILFSSEPQIFAKEVYVSESELASALGLYVKLESDRYIILYKNNVFVKLDLESTTASVNGKLKTLPSAPFYSDQRIFVPLLFLAESFHFESEWNKSTGELKLTDGNLADQFDFIESNNFYKRVDIAKLGVRISIPDHWQMLNKDSQNYGYTDDYEYFTLEISQKKIDPSHSLERIETQIEKDIVQRDPKNTQITKVNKGTATQLSSYAIFSDFNSGKKTYKQVTYLFKDKQTAYILHFKYGSATDMQQALTITNTIADSFQINQLTIQERDEHYVEFPNFYRLGINLETPIYANQTANEFILLKGSVENAIDGFNVNVTKDSQVISFYIPVKNKKFEQKIYLPFGLGKHIIFMEEAERSGLLSKKNEDKHFEPIVNYDDKNVLQFSILNTSSSSIRYLIPSSRVPSDLEKMSSLGKLLTYKEDTSYKKSKAVFHWIEQNIKLDTSAPADKLRSPVQVFDDSLGTEEELAYFYATLLRSIELPCRIVTGDYNNSSHYWNELFINGKWIVADLGEEFTKGDGITAYFNLNRDEHYSAYTNIKVLEY